MQNGSPNLNDMKNSEQPIIVGLDIGTTKVVAIAGRKNAFGKLDILAVGQVESVGVNQGMVLNIDQCTNAINQAIDNCVGANSELQIKDVYVGISGQHIRNVQTNGTRLRNRADNEISGKDLDLMICEQYKTHIPADEQIIDVIPQEYCVDDIEGIVSPIGMCGSKIEANFNLITGKTNIIHNIERSIARSFLKTQKIILQSVASVAAVTSNDDLEAGVMVLDIGGGTTDVAVYQKGILKFNMVIPMGGVTITNAVSDGLGVLRAQAESLKIDYGTMILTGEDEPVSITLQNLKGLPPKEISLKLLSDIIKTSVEEILDYAMYNLKKKNLEKHLYGGIIMTGGSSQLRGLAQFTEQITGMDVRIGHPDVQLADDYPQILASPAYATSVGLILQGYEHYASSCEVEFVKNIQHAEASELTLTVSNIVDAKPVPALVNADISKRNKGRNIISVLKDRFMGLFEKTEDELYMHTEH